MTTPHAKVSDLPGWPCPPRVRDIPDSPHSWGRIDVYQWQTTGEPPVAYDELDSWLPVTAVAAELPSFITIK